jgi:IS30 family transposase
MPSVRLAETARPNRYRTIAARLGRAPSTVSRELRRNLRRHDGGCYDGDLAHARVRERARRRCCGRLLADPQLRPEVLQKWIKVVDDQVAWDMVI